jgi:hypothetical protein
MIPFPEPPERVLNYVFTTGGKSWKWNGVAWLVHNSGGGGGVTSYNDLTDLPTLGTAAATNAVDYATAAQGTKADSALQSSDLTPYRTSADQDTIDSGKANVSHYHSADDITSGVLDVARIPVLPSQKQIISSQGIPELTTTQQTEIDKGTIVTTTDGKRWVYTGTGAKDLESSYIVLADITPDWSTIANKPTFGTAATTASTDYATSLQGGLADSASQPGHTHSLDELEQGTATSGQVIAWNGTTWAPQTPSTGGSSVSVADNSGITLTSNTLATAYNTTIGDSVVSVSVGGAPATAASVWKTKSIVQVLDDILFPTILASIGSAKSTTLSVSGSSGTLEIGTLISRTLTAAFSRGTIKDGSGATNPNPLVGAATGYTFTGTGISSTSQVGNTLTFNSSVVSGSNQWSVSVAHDAGTGTYTDNKGVAGTNLNASRVSGSSTASTTAITGVHPYYFYKSASPISAAAMVAAMQDGTATKVTASSTGTLSIPYNVDEEYLAVAYPTTSTLKTRYYVTVSDADVITVVFHPVTTPSVTTPLWTQTYNVHVSKSALTNTNAYIELRNP